MGGQHEIDSVLKPCQATAEGLPVVAAGLDETGQLLELLAANGGLRV